MKIALFGCGTGLALYLELAGEDIKQVSVIFDNHNTAEEVNGIPLANTARLGEIDFDKIVITSRHYVEIYQQLLLQEVPKDKIEVFAGLYNVL